VLVDHGGIGVAAADYGGKRCFFFFSPLFRLYYLLTLVFCSLLSTMFLPLYSGFMEVLLVLAVPLVASKRRTGRGTQRLLLWFLFCIFFFFLLPSACVSVLPSLYSLLFSLSFSFFSLLFLSVSPLSLFFFFSLSRLLCLLLPPPFGSSSGFYS